MFSAAGVTGSCMCRAADCNRRCTTRGSGHGEPRGSGVEDRAQQHGSLLRSCTNVKNVV